MTARYCLAVAALALAFPAAASAEDVLLKVGQPLARAKLLKPGVQRYLRYIVKDGHRNTIDIWQRAIAFEEKDGRKLVRITQLWDQVSEPGFYSTQESVLEARTMRPITHVRSRTKAGKTEIGAYRFDGTSISGISDYPDNLRKDFAVTAEEPTYNFVVDIEFFRQLPLAAGRAFTATLYDPPGSAPARYTFKVAGSDTVPGPDGRPVDCWVLTSDYNRPEKPVSRYWFAKHNQYLVKQESPLDDGSTLVKTLLSSEAADALG